MSHPNDPDKDTQDAETVIVEQLKSLYDSVLNEPIPDNLIRLLIKLDEAESANGSHAASNEKHSPSE